MIILAKKMAETKVRCNLFNYFEDLKDPRSPYGKIHSLETILTIAILGMICGADEWVEIEEFGRAKESMLRQYFGVADRGIPSHDTFGRVFGALQPEAFQACFRSYTESLAEQATYLNIDGKTLRGSYDTYKGEDAKHIVSAWANESRLVLAQVVTDDKSNEITAIPELLGLLHLSGCIITIDAMGTQTAIAEQITEREADYVLALKGNQSGLHEQVQECFEKVGVQSAVQTLEQIDADHGRFEKRTYQVCPVQGYLTADLIDRWPQLKSMIMVNSQVELINGRKSGHQRNERRFFISSLEVDEHEKIARAIRGHWGIENSLHYVLDVAFGEDQNRTRINNAAVNQSVIRHFALNQLRQEASAKVGIKAKRKKAGWDERYLLKVLLA
jgi:predicted transposase YbfD/YdcC